MNDFITSSYYNGLQIDELAQKIQNSVPEQIALELEKIEKEIYEHPIRKQRYKVKGIVPRTLVTPYGTVHFQRRQYIDKSSNRSIFLLDKVCHIEKYSRLTQSSIFRIAEYAIECGSYAQAGRLALIGTIISKQTAASCVDKVTTYRETKKQIPRVDVLYISVDGFFANYRDFNKKREVKFASMYTGIEALTPKRNRLMNRTIVTPRNTNQTIVNAVQETIQRNYQIHDQTRFFILGDGAPWIKELTSHFPHSVFVIDPFHYKRAIRSLSNASDIYPLIDNRDLTSLNHYFHLYTSENDIRNMKYILDHFESTKYWSDPDFIGCHTENVVSHYFNHRLRSRPRNWGKRLYKIASSLAAASSSSLQFSYAYDDSFVDSVEELFSSSSIATCKYTHSYNAPILNGARSPLTDTIHNLLYGN